MGAFAGLRDKLKVDENSRSRLPMPDLGPKAVLILAPSTSENTALMTWSVQHKGREKVLKEKIKGLTVMQARPAISEHNRKPYGLFVVMGWENVPGADGDYVEFTRENAEELCRELPVWLFDMIVDHAGEQRNFCEEWAPSLEEDEEAAEEDGREGN